MSINKALLIGRLGKDPEIRYTPSGTQVATFSLATSERFKDRDGNQQERTEWHNIVVWRKLAEICGKYLTKGSQIYLEGKIQTRSYDDRDGNKRYITEIIADQMRMLGSKNSSTNQNNSQPQQQNNDGWGDEPVFTASDEIPF